MALSDPTGLGGCYLTAETGTDNADGSGVFKWQLRDAAGRAIARQAIVTTWYMQALSNTVPATATGDFSPTGANANLKTEVAADQEYIAITDATGLLQMDVVSGDGALYAYAHPGNGNGAIATVTVTGT